MAVFARKGRQVAEIVQVGTVVFVKEEELHNSGLIEVFFSEHYAWMFA
jgi:hypothetical protein